MNEQILYDIKINGQDKLDKLNGSIFEQQKQVKASKDLIKFYEQELKRLSKAGELTAEKEAELNSKLKETTQSFNSSNQELKNLNKEKRDATKVVDMYNQSIQAEIGSNKQLRAQLFLQTKRYDEMGQEQRELTDEGKNLANSIKAISDKLKENEGAVGDNRRNVGNYTESIEKALGNVNVFGVNLGQLTTQMKSSMEAGKGVVKTIKEYIAGTTASAAATKGATVATGGMSKALRILKIALISTGIGAIVVVLGSLIAAFASTQAGIDKVNSVLRPLQALFQAFIGVAQDLGTNLIESFSNPKQAVKDLFNVIKENLINRVKAIPQFYKGIFDTIASTFSFLGNKIKVALADVPIIGKDIDGDKAAKDAEEALKAIEKNAKKTGQALVQFGTGLNEEQQKSLAEGFKSTGDIFADALEKGKLINDTIIQREKLESTIASRNAELSKQLKEQDTILSNTALSGEERVKAQEEAERLAKQMVDNENEIVDLMITELELKQSLNDTSREEDEQLDALIAKRIANAEKIDQVEKKGNAARKNAQDEQRQAEKARQQARQQADEDAKTEEERLKTVAELSRTELEQVKFLFDEKKNTLGLDKQRADLTETEIKALDKITEQYQEQVAQINDKNKVQETTAEELLERELVNLELRAIKDLESTTLTEEGKKAIIDKYNADKIEAQKTFFENQIRDVESQLGNVEASVTGSLLTMSDEEEAEFNQQLLDAKKGLATLTGGGEDLSGEEPTTGEGEGGKTIQDMLGLDEEGSAKLTFAVETVKSSIQSIGNLMSSITERNKKLINEQVKEGVLTQEQADKKIEKIEKQAFKRNKAMQVSMAIINTGQAVANALAQTTDFTPTQSLRIANAATAGILGGIQVSTIMAQKFATGGKVTGAGTATSDDIPAMLSNGEFVQQTKAVNYYGTDFMNALNNLQVPRFFSTGGLVTPQPPQSTQSAIGDVAERIDSQDLRVINVESDFTSTQNKVRNVESATTF